MPKPQNTLITFIPNYDLANNRSISVPEGKPGYTWVSIPDPNLISHGPEGDPNHLSKRCVSVHHIVKANSEKGMESEPRLPKNAVAQISFFAHVHFLLKIKSVFWGIPMKLELFFICNVSRFSASDGKIRCSTWNDCY